MKTKLIGLGILAAVIIAAAAYVFISMVLCQEKVQIKCNQFSLF